MKRIGVGGMGEVFLMPDGRAKKQLLPHLARDKRFLDLFLQEIRVAAQLSHPNIVQIFEFSDDFLVMEYVEGRDLRGVSLPPGLAALVASQAAGALHYAHKARDRQGRSLKVLHRDVSPHNVLVSNAGQVKLIDFGVARAADGLPGKMPYLAPEVAEGGAASPSSDQFSLGVVLWELITRKRLFKAASDAMTLQKVIACEVPRPGALDEVVMRALSKDPAGRYPDCAAFARALDDVLLEIDGPSHAAELGAAIQRMQPMR